MEQEYTITQEIKSETKIQWGIYAFDFFFLIIYAIVTYMLSKVVHEALVVPFFLFSAAMGIFLTMPSMFNKKRRNYQSIIIYLKKDVAVYRPVKNVSKLLHYNEKREEVEEKWMQ